MGERLRAQRRMHQGLRLRRQSALPARHGARRHGARQGRPRRRSASGGVEDFRKVAREVTHISRLQLDDALLARLGQDAAAAGRRADERPDFVFYTGCNVLKTPHIALLALDIMDALGVTYRGAWAARAIAAASCRCAPAISTTSGRMAENTHGQAGRRASPGR